MFRKLPLWKTWLQHGAALTRFKHHLWAELNMFLIYATALLKSRAVAQRGYMIKTRFSSISAGKIWLCFNQVRAMPHSQELHVPVFIVQEGPQPASVPCRSQLTLITKTPTCNQTLWLTPNLSSSVQLCGPAPPSDGFADSSLKGNGCTSRKVHGCPCQHSVTQDVSSHYWINLMSGSVNINAKPVKQLKCHSSQPSAVPCVDSNTQHTASPLQFRVMP